MKKSHAFFFHVLKRYRKKKFSLPSNVCTECKELLHLLQKAILQKEQKTEQNLVKKLRVFEKRYLRRHPFFSVLHLIGSIAIGLMIALFIRSVWFELYEIPTGSMRPTIKEKDRLIVSKTTFGIRLPFVRQTLFFNPKLVKRNGLFIFSGVDMEIPDVNTRHFHIFPGKKRYVKRVIGKPGDWIYFYGGQLYGIDRKGRDLSKKLQLPLLAHIDHIPYIHLNGKLTECSQGSHASLFEIKQMNQPVAQMMGERNHFFRHTQPKGEMVPPYRGRVEDYYDLWGFKHYGLGRLLTKKQLLTINSHALPRLNEKNTPLYLEIIHHPSVIHPIWSKVGPKLYRPVVGVHSTWIPLEEKQLRTLFSLLCTARFAIKGEKMFRCTHRATGKQKEAPPHSPRLKGVSDGVYEFYQGIGYRIMWGGIRKKLSASHPLSQYSQARLQLLFNLGIECSNLFHPHAPYPTLLPSRYLYYRHGDLYTMGQKFLSQSDQTLKDFLTKERFKASQSLTSLPYHAFEDQPPPLTEKGIDVAFIQKYGLHVPEKHYLVLGDNCAMSSDSRDFGFVPQENIRGAPVWIFWPPNQCGYPNQPPYSRWHFSNVAVWVMAILCGGGWWFYRRKKHSLPTQIP